MPAATTHVAFAKDVYRLNPDVQAKAVNMQMYLLGSQGPDLLFFSRASILPGSLKKYGNLMHEHKVYEIIRYFEQYAKKDPDLTSYIYGYLCPGFDFINSAFQKFTNHHQRPVHFQKLYSIFASSVLVSF